MMMMMCVHDVCMWCDVCDVCVCVRACVVCVLRVNLGEGVRYDVISTDVEVQKRSIPNSSQESVHKRPLPLCDVTRPVVQQEFLNLVRSAQNKGVLKEREVLLVNKRVSVELVVVGHGHSSVEELVTKLLPLDDGLQYVDRVDLNKHTHTHTQSVH